MSASWYRWKGDRLELALRVQPRAARDEVLGPQGERLKVKLNAPPVGGAANDALLRLLAKEFRVPRSRVTLLSGRAGRDKRVAVQAPEALPSWLG